MQFSSFAAAALYSGIWCVWAKGGGLQGAWRQLGLLSGIMCVGSVAGAVAWGANTQNLFLYYPAMSLQHVSPQHSYTLFASSDRWFASYLIIYGFEFMCLIMCKLMLLSRLAANAAQSSQADVTEMSGVRRRWLNGRALPIVYRVMAASVVVGSVVGMVALAVSGANWVQQAGLYDQAAAACDAAGNDTNSSLAFYNAAIAITTKSRFYGSVQAGSEAITLLFVTLAYVVTVSWSVAIFRIAELVAARSLLYVDLEDPRNMRPDEANASRIVAATKQAAAENRRRLTAACVIVLVTYPARAAFDLLQAYALSNGPFNPACRLCDPCQSTPYLINNWLIFTPEFQPIVVAVSSPLPLTLSLWLLTKAVASSRLIAADVERARAGDGV